MPTGYTTFIEDGTITTGKDFLMLCTREFSATSPMGEEPLTTPIPKEFKPRDFCIKDIEKKRKRLEWLRTITNEEIQLTIDKEFETAVKGYNEYKEKQTKLRHIYEDIYREIQEWKEPTKGHWELKRFALEQIECSFLDTKIRLEEPKRKSVDEWLQEELSLCLQDIKRYERMQKEEIAQIESKNKWLKELRDSLGVE